MVKAHVSYTQAHFDALVLSIRRRSRKSDIMYGIILLLSVIVCAASAVRVVLHNIPMTLKMRVAFFVIAVCVVLYIGGGLYIRIIIPRRAAKKQGRRGSVILFTIDGGGVKAESSGETYCFDWKHTLRAEHSGAFFVVYRTEKTVFMIGDADITEGTPDGLEQLLRENLGERFKKY